jgi:hypothetical protein
VRPAVPPLPELGHPAAAGLWSQTRFPDWLRLYGEVGYSFFNAGGSQPWEFQYGTELIQARATGIHGAPFFAINGMA